MKNLSNIENLSKGITVLNVSQLSSLRGGEDAIEKIELAVEKVERAK